MMDDFTIGTLLALGAAILFGAHTSFAKVKSVRESRVPVPIYNIYFLIGAALVCFVEYFIMIGLGASIEFTYLGIICAFLLLCFETFLVLSIQQIGVCIRSDCTHCADHIGSAYREHRGDGGRTAH